MANTLFDFSHLTAEERVQLAEDLWKSLSQLKEPLSLTKAQEQELDRRLDTYRKDREPGTPWAEALREIEEGGPMDHA